MATLAAAAAVVLSQPVPGVADALVAEGARWWSASRDPANLVGCATCHQDPSEVRGWAASFPKFQPQFPPHARVMTLLQATAEAVRTHYGHADPLPAATAITAFIARLGAGQPPTPGIAPGEPAGLMLLERGELHGNVWDGGGVVSDGRFRIRVPGGGQYGLHVYASGYFYRPQAVTVATGQTLSLDLLLAPEPTRERDPVIKRVGFFPSDEQPGRLTYVKVDVADPDDNLGPQVMAFNAATGRAYAMDPS